MKYLIIVETRKQTIVKKYYDSETYEKALKDFHEMAIISGKYTSIETYTGEQKSAACYYDD